MSSFEEEFPSLKNTGINCGLSDVELATRELVQKHTIDRQRVREVFMQYRKYSPTIIDDMMEELGLEDE